MTQIQAGDMLPGRAFTTDTVQLFLYNAVLWNAHRIHFDLPYATEVEGYPGLVNAGPLMGDWVTQCIIEWLGDRGSLKTLKYSNRGASILPETLRFEGEVVSVDSDAGTADLAVRIINEADQVILPGTAVVSLD